MSWDMKHIGELESLWQRDIRGELSKVQLNYMLNQYGIDKEEYRRYQSKRLEEQFKAVRMTMIKVVAIIIVGYFVLNAIL